MAATISAADDGIDWAIAELTCPSEGSAAPAARATDDVRTSRRERSSVIPCSRLMLPNVYPFGRLSNTRLALPSERSSVSGATTLICVLMPMVFLMKVETFSA